MSLTILNARILTLRPTAARSGGDPADLGVIERGSVVIEGDRITEVGPSAAGPPHTPPRIPHTREILDAGGRVLLPGFVDCHTHACWAGDRLDEWEQRRRGVSYLDILKAGGGIMSTVRAVRGASQETLEHLLVERLGVTLASGTTTIEVKSGYGLSPTDELKMLRAIRGAAEIFPGTVVATALLGHAMDPEQVAAKGEDGFVDDMVRQGLSAVSKEFPPPGIAVDAYCESGAWSVEQCERLFNAARSAGHPVRVHADQFNSLGMTPRAVQLGARSVDHLEAATPADLAALAASNGTYGVILPICGLHLDDRYARVGSMPAAFRAERLAVATNLNPGSAPSGSMPLAIGLAVRKCGLSPAEAILAATRTPARLLGLNDRGIVAPGMRADLVLLDHRDERELAYGFGHGAVKLVICAGEILRHES